MLVDIEQLARRYIMYRGGSEEAEHGVLPPSHLISSNFINRFVELYPLRLIDWYYDFKFMDYELISGKTKISYKNSIWFLDKVMLMTHSRVYLCIAESFVSADDKYSEDIILHFISVLDRSNIGETRSSLIALYNNINLPRVLYAISQLAHQMKLYDVVLGLETLIFTQHDKADKLAYIKFRSENMIINMKNLNSNQN